MLRLVAQGLGLSIDGVVKAQLLDRVERALHEQVRLRKHVLIIVDEAQNLSTSALEELRMLSNYHIANRSAVQIMMLGQPQFRDRLRESPDLEQLRQRVIATHHLDPRKRRSAPISCSVWVRSAMPACRNSRPGPSPPYITRPEACRVS